MTKKIWKDPHASREADKYAKPIPSRECIMDYLATLDGSTTLQKIANYLQLEEDDELEALRRRLIAMVRDGQLVEVKRQCYQLMSEGTLVHGRVQANKEGFGFLIPHDGSNDIFLPARQMSKVLDGDEVAVQVTVVDQRGRREGHIATIIKRAHTEIVGRFFVEAGVGFVQPVNKRLAQPIVVLNKEDQAGAKQGEVVVVKIVAYPTGKTSMVGRIQEVLGDHMAPGMEVEMAIRAHGLPHKWPHAVTKAAAELDKVVSEKDKKARKDLRDLAFVTIDGEDAKDFDDAVFCEKKRLGGWRLYVAIADVDHYVSSGNVLDKEAYLRGTSVYFPGEVIPMLPKALSNGLCSLNPKVDRLTMVCEMVISSSGELKRYEFYPAVIHSKARLTYNEVSDFLEKKTAETTISAEIQPHLVMLYALYKALHRARVSSGAIAFDTTEVKVLFGAQRKIKQLVPVVRNDAHRLIEECMLCANVASARFLLKNKCDALYRVHNGPKKERLEDLHSFLRGLGLHLAGKMSPKPKDYAAVLRDVQGRPDEHLVQTMLLRSMSQAYYTPENSGHFGLAFDAYTHFTSPIRRYPDLLVHRAIKAVLNKKKKSLPGYDDLLLVGQHCSETERRADDATREALAFLKCEYMLNKVNEEFNGVITGVTSFGIFVELEDIFTEGLIHIKDLPQDYYHFDPAKQNLTGRRSNTVYRLGDAVRVKVVRVNVDEKQIDFIFSDTPAKLKKKEGPAKPRRKRR